MFCQRLNAYWPHLRSILIAILLLYPFSGVYLSSQDFELLRTEVQFGTLDSFCVILFLCFLFFAVVGFVSLTTPIIAQESSQSRHRPKFLCIKTYPAVLEFSLWPTYQKLLCLCDFCVKNKSIQLLSLQCRNGSLCLKCVEKQT